MVVLLEVSAALPRHQECVRRPGLQRMDSRGNLIEDGDHIFLEGGAMPVLAAQALDTFDGEMDQKIMSDKVYRQWGGSRCARS